MRRNAILVVVLVAAGTGLFARAIELHAQQIVRHTIDTGGGRSVGGSFVVDGTLGQSDAGLLAGGEFRLRGGFWIDLEPSPDNIFSDGFD